jgi:hypothetical protein
MKLHQKIIARGILVGGLLGLLGCREGSNRELKNITVTPSPFATVPMNCESGIAMTNGDFDGDGDLDLVVGAYEPGERRAILYLLKNNGQKLSDPSPFATVSMYSESGIAMTNGDFDGDGDLDLVVGAYKLGERRAGLYRFNNDGRGNLSQ